MGRTSHRTSALLRCEMNPKSCCSRIEDALRRRADLYRGHRFVLSCVIFHSAAHYKLPEVVATPNCGHPNAEGHDAEDESAHHAPWNGDVRRLLLKTEVSSSSPSLGMPREGVAVYEQTCEIYDRGCNLVDLLAPPVTSSTMPYSLATSVCHLVLHHLGDTRDLRRLRARTGRHIIITILRRLAQRGRSRVELLLLSSSRLLGFGPPRREEPPWPLSLARAIAQTLCAFGRVPTLLRRVSGFGGGGCQRRRPFDACDLLLLLPWLGGVRPIAIAPRGGTAIARLTPPSEEATHARQPTRARLGLRLWRRHRVLVGAQHSTARRGGGDSQPKLRDCRRFWRDHLPT